MQHRKILPSITNVDDHCLRRYLNEIGKISALSAEEELVLIEKIQKGDQQARELLVKSNLRFVVSIAKQYRHSRVSLCDLINDGNIGLIKAAKRFDASHGFRFLSYAVWWIRQSITTALREHSQIVHLPQNQTDALSKIKKARVLLEQRLERQPSVEELALYLDLSSSKISESLLNSENYVSLHNPVSDNNESSLLDILPDADHTTDNALLRESLSNDVNRCIAVLPQRECEVLKLYFGIGYQNPLTLEEISDKFCLSRERVRQLKDKAIQQLQATSSSFSYLWSA